jgi:hypothetical protein
MSMRGVQSFVRRTRERAGLQPPPADLAARGLHERWRRTFEDRGNAFEVFLARELGTTRAHELRSATNGWPGDARMMNHGCPEGYVKPTRRED